MATTVPTRVPRSADFSKPGYMTTTPTVGPDSAADEPTATFRRLAQLRDSGAFAEAEFQAKRSEMLNRLERGLGTGNK